MRFVIDEMHAAAIAVALRAEGIDAVAVTEGDGLRGMSDAHLLAWASEEGRAVVTENVADFATLAQRWALDGREHAGLVFTNPRRFHRAARSYPQDVVAALVALDRSGWTCPPPQVWWL